VGRRGSAGIAKLFIERDVMTDSLTQITAQVAAPGTAGAASPALANPAEARLFAGHMQTDGLAEGPAQAAHVTGSTAVPALLQSLANQMQARPVEDIQRSMLAAIDPEDPAKTMVAMTNFSMEATASMSRLHLCSSLASAATSLFGTLLKNQQ
jgi:hypothetical protein